MENGEYTTICIDKYGRVYDLSEEHPSWEQERTKKEGTSLRPIVVDAYPCLIDNIPKSRRKKNDSRDTSRRRR